MRSSLRSRAGGAGGARHKRLLLFRVASSPDSSGSDRGGPQARFRWGDRLRSSAIDAPGRRPLIVSGDRFTDEGDCQWGDCTRYRADGVWNDEYVGIRVSQYEGGDYLLVGGSQSWTIRSRPITSPNGQRFFTGFHADNEEWTPSDGASVWDWNDYPRRLRVVDTHLVVFDQLTRWLGDSCIEFTGTRGGYGGDDMESQRTFWLVEQNRDWQLLEEQPATCH